MNIFSIITVPLGLLMNFIYSLVGNYGVAIIILTIIIKGLLYPLNLKSQKAMIEMQKVKPLLDEVNKKYKNDKEKMQKETLKIYKEHKINPAGGCLPTLLQFPIIFALYYIVREPLIYMFKFSFDKVDKVLQIFFNGQNISESFIALVNSIKAGAATIANSEITVDFIKNHQIEIADALNKNIGNVIEVGGQAIHTIDFSFLGINLAGTPNVGVLNIYWLIPIIATGLTYITSVMTQRSQRLNSAPAADDAGGAAQMGKSMMYMMPLMTLIFTFTLPSGLGLYWIVSSLIQIVQQYFTNKQVNKVREEVIVSNVKKSRKNS